MKTRIGQPVVIEHVAAEAAQTIKEGKMQLGLIGPGRMSITMASGHIDYLGDVCPATATRNCGEGRGARYRLRNAVQPL